MGTLGTHEVSATVGDSQLTYETGKLAEQAGGAVVARLGDTALLVTATASSQPKEHLDFLPLTIDYEERMYAAGKIPGGFFKREGRPSENAILTCRLVDRPMRPTFDSGLRNEVQVLVTTLSADQVNAPDVLAINGASMATMLSGLPFDGPVAGLRMGLDRDGNWHPFPSFAFRAEEAIFDLVVAGRLHAETGEVDLLMVEAEATDHAAERVDAGAVAPTEEVLGAALEEAKGYLRQLGELQLRCVEEAGTRDAGQYPLYPAYAEKVSEAIGSAVSDDLATVLADSSLAKAERTERTNELRESAIDAAFNDAGDVDVSDDELERQAKNAFRDLEKKLIRRRVVNEGVRIDGRAPQDIRPLSAEVGVLPLAHGSGLFRRGETQALTIATLGMLREAQRLDNLDPVEQKRYIHHYNFPPFSTGETGFMRGPKRREVGHGALAERALLPVVPDEDSFPYALRLVSEIVSSNGSTSMASVCGSSLSMMDAGVPLWAPVAGIAMGLVAEDGKYTTLTDIQGAEDAFGDMDFKVAGTSEFVTALQLDTKLSGIPAQVLSDALTQAKQARSQVLGAITDCIPAPRSEMNPNAPRVLVEHIPSDKVGEVIGPKGKIVREISEETGAQIDVADDENYGVVHIYSSDGNMAQMALERVQAIANPVVPKQGERYYGTVVKTLDFGAFVSLTPGSDGLVHISKLGGDRRLEHASEAVDVGDHLWVEIAEVKEGGKYSLVPVEGPADRSPEQPETSAAPSGPAPADAASPAAGAAASSASTAGADPGDGGSARSRVRQRGDAAGDGSGNGGERRTRVRERTGESGDAGQGRRQRTRNRG
jgi:polyribonucleotide nucleotidyltransferase